MVVSSWASTAVGLSFENDKTQNLNKQSPAAPLEFYTEKRCFAAAGARTHTRGTNQLTQMIVYTLTSLKPRSSFICKIVYNSFTLLRQSLFT